MMSHIRDDVVLKPFISKWNKAKAATTIIWASQFSQHDVTYYDESTQNREKEIKKSTAVISA